jgi:ribonuclease HII
MGEFAAQNSTISVRSAAKRPVSKKSGRADGSKKLTGPASALAPLFQELARLAEMSAVERRLRERGFRLVAGTDEVGRGCLAGPVVAAAVIFDHPTLFGVNDSKRLSPIDRAEICRHIMTRARAVAVGVVEPQVIDRINILQASKLAMSQAIENLLPRPDALLLDAVGLETLELPQLPIIAGDRRSVSIAAASIVAKVYRDQLMESYHVLYPDYDFANNRGYGTESHMEALRRFGPTPIHRRSFLGMTESSLLFEQDRKDGRPAR